MKFRNFLFAGILSMSLIPFNASAADDGTCRRLAREQGITYSGAWEMNVVGCVYSRSKGYYVPRSNTCNGKARYWAQKWPYRRGWEMARFITDRYTYCEVDNLGRYFVG